MFSPQGTSLLTASADATARLWDVDSNSCLQASQSVSGYSYTYNEKTEGAREGGKGGG